jgi:hypothetical protein
MTESEDNHQPNKDIFIRKEKKRDMEKENKEKEQKTTNNM